MDRVKGMRDFLPEDMIIREYVIDKIKAVYKKYGYDPMDSPVMEKLDVLKAKSGDEVAGQIFKIENSDIGLRFDLTVPFARIAANNTFAKPLKKYFIGKVWRREEPQKGRYREFLQMDPDVVGSKSMRCEAEILTIVDEVLNEFGFKEKKIIINNRKILNALAKKVGVEDKRNSLFRELDKMDKKGERQVKKEIAKLIGEEKMKEFFSYLIVKGTNKEKIDAAKKIDEEGAKELETILDLCEFEITVDLTLVRGLGYYTGPVFEVKLSDEIGSIAGGGRYDNLLGLYGQSDYATGISFGIERLIYLLKKRKMKPTTKVFVASLKGCYKYSLKVAKKLRENGINCQTDLNERNIRKQLDYANSLKIPFVIVVGKKEMDENKVTLKNMESGNEEYLSVEEAVKKLN